MRMRTTWLRRLLRKWPFDQLPISRKRNCKFTVCCKDMAERKTKELIMHTVRVFSIGILRHWLPSLAFLFFLKLLAGWRWMSAWLGHNPSTDEQAQAHAKNKKVSAALRKSIYPSLHSLPLVLYLLSFTARIDIRNRPCLVPPLDQQRVIFMNRQKQEAFFRPRSKLCPPPPPLFFPVFFIFNS